jgi:hypothetical protein
VTTALSQLTTATPAVVLGVALLVSLAKPFLETWLLPVNSPLHDAGIRLFCVFVGVLIVASASLLALAPGQAATGTLFFLAAVEGGKAALGAIVTYHVVTGSVFNTAPDNAVPGGGLEVKPPAAAELAPRRSM